MVYVGTVATSDGDRIRTLGAINGASIHAQIRALPGNCQVPLVLLMLNNWCLSCISVRSVHYICILHPTATAFKLYFAIVCNRCNVGFIHFLRRVNMIYNTLGWHRRTSNNRITPNTLIPPLWTQQVRFSVTIAPGKTITTRASRTHVFLHRILN